MPLAQDKTGNEAAISRICLKENNNGEKTPRENREKIAVRSPFSSSV